MKHGVDFTQQKQWQTETGCPETMISKMSLPKRHKTFSEKKYYRMKTDPNIYSKLLLDKDPGMLEYCKNVWHDVNRKWIQIWKLFIELIHKQSCVRNHNNSGSNIVRCIPKIYSSKMLRCDVKYMLYVVSCMKYCTCWIIIIRSYHFLWNHDCCRYRY